MYTRCGPYLCGMMVAYLHFKNPKHDYCQGAIVYEWIAFSILLIIMFVIGGLPKGDYYHGFKLSPVLQTIHQVIGRTLFGACLSYLILLILSPSSSELPWYRPVRSLKAFLTFKIWIPVAYLSYSAYIAHG